MYGQSNERSSGAMLKDPYVSAAPLGTAAEPVGHIVQGMQEHDRLTMTLADELGILEARLSGVLRPVPPQPTTEGAGTPRPVASAMADGLSDFNRRLFMAIDRVRSLAARVDL